MIRYYIELLLNKLMTSEYSFIAWLLLAVFYIYLIWTLICFLKREFKRLKNIIVIKNWAQANGGKCHKDLPNDLADLPTYECLPLASTYRIHNAYEIQTGTNYAIAFNCSGWSDDTGISDNSKDRIFHYLAGIAIKIKNKMPSICICQNKHLDEIHKFKLPMILEEEFSEKYKIISNVPDIALNIANKSVRQYILKQEQSFNIAYSENYIIIYKLDSVINVSELDTAVEMASSLAMLLPQENEVINV